MAFERDKDWYTRGVGAIAARDRSAVRAAQTRMRASVLQARDRKMSDLARLGGLGLMRSEGDRDPTASGTSGGGTPSGGTYTTVYTMNPSIRNATIEPTVPLTHNPGPWGSTPPPTSPPPTGTKVSTVTLPSSGATPKTLSSGPKVSTSGGGIVSGSSGPNSIVVVDPASGPPITVDTSSLPGVTDVSLDWKSKLMALPTGQKVAIGAAIAGGLYLLFGRKK